LTPISPNTAAIFGATLRKLRTDRCLAQERLATRCGLNRTYISLLERGRYAPSLDTMLVLADGLSLSFFELAAAFEANLLLVQRTIATTQE